MMSRTPVVLAAAAIALASVCAPASAQTYLADPKNTCTALNCTSQTIQGSVPSVQEFGFGTARLPAHFVTQVYVQAGECLRLEVSSQEDDLALAVQAPWVLSPNNWQDDDSAGNLRPRVVINNTPVSGWYTVLLRVWDGFSVDADFVLKYGRYPLGNPNCSPATSPSFAEALQEQTAAKTPR